MLDDHGNMEELMSGIGITLAAAVVLIIVFTLFRSAGTEDTAIALQSATSEVCGDIGTVATSAVSCRSTEVYAMNGIGLDITSDYVIAHGTADNVFARQLPLRVYPGKYDEENAAWNDTVGYREFLNATFNRSGAIESPLSPGNFTDLSGIMERARNRMVSAPLDVDPGKPVIVEKLYVYVLNETSLERGCDQYVFIYQ